jgi:zinc protease
VNVLNDFAPQIAFREFRRTLLGRNSAYGHQTEYATIDAIRREDLLAFHKQFFQPENVIVGVWGDFGAEMKPRIEKLLGAWPKGTEVDITIPKAPVAP